MFYDRMARSGATILATRRSLILLPGAYRRRGAITRSPVDQLLGHLHRLNRNLPNQRPMHRTTVRHRNQRQTLFDREIAG